MNEIELRTLFYKCTGEISVSNSGKFAAFCAGVRSQQAEIEHYMSAHALAFKQAMDNGEARDKAYARIEELEGCLNQIAAIRPQDVEGGINGNDAPHVVWTKYRQAILSRSRT